MPEYEAMMEAVLAREQRDRRFAATMTANLMNCWLQKPVTADRLLGLEAESFAGMNPAQRQRALAAAWKKRGRKPPKARGLQTSARGGRGR